MRRLAQVVVLAYLSAMASAALAFDNGQYENVPPDIRAWFKSVMAPNGVPCCDISDGHRTIYDVREGAYWVPIEGLVEREPGRHRSTSSARAASSRSSKACLTVPTIW